MHKRRFGLALLLCELISIIIYIFIGSLTYAEPAVKAATSKNVNKLVLIVADSLELKDFQCCSFVYAMMQKSSIALMNNRQLGKHSAFKSRLNIGTGSRLEINKGLLNASAVFDAEKGEYNISYMDIDKLINLNNNSEYKEKIGYIGDMLNSNNLKTCLLGSSDINIRTASNINIDQEDRSGALIAMNSLGTVDIGNVEDILTYDYDFPGYKITDYIKLEELYKQFLPACSFMVIDIGDFSRLDANKSTVNKELYMKSKQKALDLMDSFIASIIKQSDEATAFIILSSYPSRENLKNGNKLTPVIIYNSSQGETLYSSSTRRNGIIINTDIADLILNRLGISTVSNISRIPSKDNYNTLIRANENIIGVSKLRLPVLTSYAIYEIISAIIALIYLVAMKKIKHKSLDYACRIILLSNMTAPLVLLYMSLIKIRSVTPYIVIFFITAFVLSYMIKYFSKVKHSTALKGAKNKKLKINNSIIALAIITFIMTASMMGDTITGGSLIKHSVLGYDPIIGARFYGIGNEYAGVFIGVSILFICSALELFKDKISEIMKKILLVLYFTICIAIMGLPFLGANFGSTIAALTGYFFVYAYINKINISKKSILVFGSLMLLLIAGIIAIDMAGSSQASHIGRFASDVGKNGINVLFSTASRKLAMNIKLIKYTIWTKVLICLLMIILIMFFRPVKIINRIFSRYKYLTGAWVGISAAGIMGLFVNDSGIVMAATAMIYICYPMLMICTDEMDDDINLIQSGGIYGV